PEVSWTGPAATRPRIDERRNRNSAQDRPAAGPASEGSSALRRRLRLSAQPRSSSGLARHRRRDSGDGTYRDERGWSVGGTGPHRRADGQDAKPTLWIHRRLSGHERVSADRHSRTETSAS